MLNRFKKTNTYITMKNIFKLPISDRLKDVTRLPIIRSLTKQKKLYVNTKFKYNPTNNHSRRRRPNEKGFLGKKSNPRWKNIRINTRTFFL